MVEPEVEPVTEPLVEPVEEPVVDEPVVELPVVELPDVELPPVELPEFGELLLVEVVLEETFIPLPQLLKKKITAPMSKATPTKRFRIERL